MFAQEYFSPSYFSPLYFAPSGDESGDEPGPPSPIPGYRDRDAYAAILAALKSSGEFGVVAFGLSLVSAVLEAESSPVAVVIPLGWEEEDDADPIVNVRHVRYTLIVSVRNENPLEAYQRLDRLMSIAQNLLDGSDLGGCLPGMTKLRRGRRDVEAPHPEHRVLLAGEFTYLISTQAGHDLTA